jgi:hypothetical protein
LQRQRGVERDDACCAGSNSSQVNGPKQILLLKEIGKASAPNPRTTLMKNIAAFPGRLIDFGQA